MGCHARQAAFCNVDYLGKLKSLLKLEGSVFAINVSARESEMASLVSQNVQYLFGSVFVASLDDGEEDEASNFAIIYRHIPSFTRQPSS